MILKVDSLGLRYDDSVILQDVNFSLSGSEWVALLGPNGAGKSSLMRCLLGREENFTGNVLLRDDTSDSPLKPLRELSRKSLASLISYVPQAHPADFSYTVFDTVLMGRVRNLSLFETPKKEDEEKVAEVLEHFSLQCFSNRLFSSLSGGEQQLVLIARAFIQGAKILLMDEPTSALDFGNQKRILNEIQKLRDDGMTILMSTHNPEHALNYADKVLVLNHGCVEDFGTPSDVLTSELLKKIYDVDVKISEVEGQKIIFD